MSILNISRKTQYKAMDKFTTIAAAVGTRSLLKKGWQSYAKQDPPENPTDSSVIMREAFMWGAAVGLGVGLSKVLMKIVLDESWEKYMGPKPA